MTIRRKLTIICDECGAEESRNTNDMLVFDDEMTEKGWTASADCSKQYCPKCSKKRAKKDKR